MEVHDGQNENIRSLLVNRVDHAIGEAVNQATANLMVQNGLHAWVGLDSLNCREYLNCKLIAKTWLVAFIVAYGAIQLSLGVRMEENLHQSNRRQISAKTSSPATGLMALV